MTTIIFDWKRTLFDPEKKSLIGGSREILKFLRLKKIRLILIGKGDLEMHKEVARLKVKKYFSKIIFINDKKDADLFRQFIDSTNPGNTFVIGDRIRSEIEIGNSLKATTVWVRQGKFSDELPDDQKKVPVYTVDSLRKLKIFLKRRFG